MELDPQKTIAIGFEWGGVETQKNKNGDSQEWVVRQHLQSSVRQVLQPLKAVDHLHSIIKYPLIAARNTAVRDKVIPAAEEGCEWALFVDNDVSITHPGWERFLSLDGDVVACECTSRVGKDAWCTPDAFHMTLWRARIEVFQAIPPPWFAYPYSADGCDLLGCECSYFANLVRSHGFRLNHGGWCGHRSKGLWQKPLGHRQPRLRFK